MAVAPVHATAFEVGQPPQPLRLEQLGRTLQFREVLLGPRVGQAEVLRAQLLDRRPKLTPGDNVTMEGVTHAKRIVMRRFRNGREVAVEGVARLPS